MSMSSKWLVHPISSQNCITSITYKLGNGKGFVHLWSFHSGWSVYLKSFYFCFRPQIEMYTPFADFAMQIWHHACLAFAGAQLEAQSLLRNELCRPGICLILFTICSLANVRVQLQDLVTGDEKHWINDKHGHDDLKSKENPLFGEPLPW